VEAALIRHQGSGFQRLLTMGLILSEPMKKVVEVPKILPKFSVEDEKKSPKTLLPAPHIARAKRAKKKQKNIGGKLQNKNKIPYPVVFKLLFLALVTLLLAAGCWLIKAQTVIR
jgi:hypothetical protein